MQQVNSDDYVHLISKHFNEEENNMPGIINKIYDVLKLILEGKINACSKEENNLRNTKECMKKNMDVL